MTVTPRTRWSEIITPEAKAVGLELYARDAAERKGGAVIYPPHNQIFRALNETLPYATKVVIVGQDPYINRGQAEGLCFSVAPGCPFPPSLQNIFQELHDDLGVPFPRSGSLVPWARQGVLLLNTSLTVAAGRPASHSDWGWGRFTGAVLKAASELDQPIVFIAWGNHARNVVAPLDLKDKWPTKALITSAHPSPMSAHRGFFGSRPFSRTNELLVQMGSTPIDWTL